MPSTIRYATLSYADEWLTTDKPAIQAIRQTDLPNEAEQLRQLEAFTHAYSVGRNFRRSSGDEHRLLPALHALQRVEFAGDVNQTYKELFQTLKDAYDTNLWSATSKLLWLRFGSPFRIWDSFADKQIGPMRDSVDWYGEYCERWNAAFAPRSEEVAAACNTLRNFADFLSPDPEEVAELRIALGQDWFHERVFDHFISAPPRPGAVPSETPHLPEELEQELLNQSQAASR